MKRRQPQDTRLNWRDPNMPVFVRVLDPRDNTVKIIPVPPEKVQEFYEAKMNSPFYDAPHYKDDPTYFLKKLK